MAYLIVREPGNVRFVVELTGPLAVGRDADNGLVIADRQVSRRHLTLAVDGGALALTDLGSTHGTLVNGKRVEAARLADGDVIQIGGVLLVAHTGALPTPNPGDSLWRTASELVEPPATSTGPAARRLRVLFDVGRLIASLDEPDRALERVLDLTLDALDCSRAVIALGGASGRRVTRARGAARDAEPSVPPAILAQVIARGEAVLVREAGPARSAMAAPLDKLGVIYVDDRGRAARFEADDLEFLAAVARLAAIALVQAEATRRAAGAVELAAGGIPPLVGDSEPMRKLRAQIARCAGADATVLVHGETGTGKELVAAHLHAASRRANQPFVALNCAAIPEALIESELFGHHKGAFTGATQPRRGRFACAHGGTLFLDEIGDLALPAQAKLLRAIESGEVQAIGADEPREVDVRIVAASHKDLLAEVAAGRFREDLYYRLDVLSIDVPPLRVRGDDVLALAEQFRAEAAARLDRPVASIGAGARAALRAYGWPGNVRQLRNEIERAVLLCETAELDAGDLRLRGTGSASSAPPPSSSSIAEDHARLDRALWELANRALDRAAGDVTAAAGLLHIAPTELDALLARDPAATVVAPSTATPWAPVEAAERQLIAEALRAAGGNVPAAARAIGISRATMYRKIARYHLQET